MSTGRQLLDELRRDEELRRALAEELLPEALRHRELRRVLQQFLKVNFMQLLYVYSDCEMCLSPLRLQVQ
jgi:hypothetical protein